MGIVVSAGQRFAAIADMQVGDGNQQAAVGTTIALLERGSRVMSAIHKRLFVGLKQEFQLLAGVFKTYLPPEYPYDVVGAQRNIKVADFDDRIDIVPIADPNIFSQSQRISMAQTQLQLAMANPQLHNLYEAFRTMYQAIGVKDIDKILPPPPQPTPIDPAVENIMALSSKPFQAFKGQDHQAHITSHLAFMSSNLARNNPMILGALEKNCFEMMIEFKDEELKIMGQFGNDPIAKLKARELDLRAMDDSVKREQAQEKLNMERSKQMMGQQQFDEKLEQNEDLAELRAETSLVKQQMSNDVKLKQDYMKQRDVKILKGPKR
jgi:hypothetical protein